MDFVKIQKNMLRDLYSWRSDPFAIKYNPFAECDFDKFSEIMNGFFTDLNDLYSGSDFKWAVVEDDQVLALIGLSQINKMMKTAEIGYQVSPSQRNKGIGTKVVNDFVKMMFTQTDLRKIRATIADGNSPSCKIVEKVGFTQEGLLRKHFLINGVETDERVYGMLRGDFTDGA